MKFNINFEKNKISSIKKAISVYRQLRTGNIPKKQISFNKEDGDVNFNCNLEGGNILCKWSNKVIKLNYKEVIYHFFIHVGYEGDRALNEKMFNKKSV